MRFSTAPAVLVAVGIIFILHTDSAPVAAEQTCSFASPSGKVYDFSSLAGVDQHFYGDSGFSAYDYYLRVCGTVDESTCRSTDPHASACQIDPAGSGGPYINGRWDDSHPATWSLINERDPSVGVQYTIQGQTCWPTDTYVTQVQLFCSPHSSSLRVTSEGCSNKYILETPLACPGPFPPSTGSCGVTTDIQTYDFSSLMGIDYHYANSGNDYYMSVCGIVNKGECVNSMPPSSYNASACHINPSSSPSVYVTGEWEGNDAAVWSYVDTARPERGVQYQIRGESYGATGGEVPATTNVQFLCSSSYQGLIGATLSGMTDSYYIGTPLACIQPPKLTCGYKGLDKTYDFRSLMVDDLKVIDGGFSYALHICGALTEAGTSATCPEFYAKSAACRSGGINVDIGDWPGVVSADWHYIDETKPELGVGYTMTGDQTCWVNGVAEKYHTNVNFECSRTSSPLRVSVNGCSHTFTYPTPLACTSTDTDSGADSDTANTQNNKIDDGQPSAASTLHSQPTSIILLVQLSFTFLLSSLFLMQ